jgi:hypothetical protein
MARHACRWLVNYSIGCTAGQDTTESTANHFKSFFLTLFRQDDIGAFTYGSISLVEHIFSLHT